MGRLIYTGRRSRPAPNPRSACPSGKFGWFSEQDALLAIEFARRDHADDLDNGGRCPRSAYLCATCSSWHLTARLQGGRGDV